MSSPNLVLPGRSLEAAENAMAGMGAHTLGGDNISASILGTPAVFTSAKFASNAAIPPRSTISTVSAFSQSGTKSQQRLVLPSVGCSVYARVIRLTQREVICDILVVERPPLTPAGGEAKPPISETPGSPSVLNHPFRGVLRSIDVRATQKDTVILTDSFRIGDIIRARVISLGDQGGYYLTTAGNEFGVVMSWSDRGNVCVPISWKEVQDVVTGAGEGRKVAKPL